MVHIWASVFVDPRAVLSLSYSASAKLCRQCRSIRWYLLYAAPDNLVETTEYVMLEELALPDHERVIMHISVGYADPNGLIRYSAKKSVGLLRRVVEDSTS